MSVKLESEKTGIEMAQRELQSLSAAKPVIANARSASVQQVTQHLQQDLNAVFAVVENLKIPGVRLVAVGLDYSADTLSLNYVLDSLAQASQVTEQLNTGYESRPWKLLGVSVNPASGTPSPANPVIAQTAQIYLQQGPAFNAQWNVHLSTIASISAASAGVTTRTPW